MENYHRWAAAFYKLEFYNVFVGISQEEKSLTHVETFLEYIYTVRRAINDWKLFTNHSNKACVVFSSSVFVFYDGKLSPGDTDCVYMSVCLICSGITQYKPQVCS